MHCHAADSAASDSESENESSSAEEAYELEESNCICPGHPGTLVFSQDPKKKTIFQVMEEENEECSDEVFESLQSGEELKFGRVMNFFDLFFRNMQLSKNEQLR